MVQPQNKQLKFNCHLQFQFIHKKQDHSQWHCSKSCSQHSSNSSLKPANRSNINEFNLSDPNGQFSKDKN